MKTVIALKEGFHDGAMVHVGTVFQVPDSLTGKWFAEYTGQKVGEAAQPADVPTTFSELRHKKPRGPLDPKPGEAAAPAEPTRALTDMTASELVQLIKDEGLEIPGARPQMGRDKLLAMVKDARAAKVAPAPAPAGEANPANQDVL